MLVPPSFDWPTSGIQRLHGQRLTGLVARLPHKLGPFRPVRLLALAVPHKDGNVGCFVAEHLS